MQIGMALLGPRGAGRRPAAGARLHYRNAAAARAPDESSPPQEKDRAMFEMIDKKTLRQQIASCRAEF
ncbi:MAG: hypothetical protein HY812_22425 [Planctomycetes bacterium]|nr:hypothetical protein [Planctomycetota bacterium]